mmetsp:Transcript_22242/g.36128  ORF Transcript_22242/g.36128 Transcript_22242/m.36128 type:complete len:82 (+) Transcript_22242:181-426(+)
MPPPPEILEDEEDKDEGRRWGVVGGRGDKPSGSIRCALPGRPWCGRRLLAPSQNHWVSSSAYGRDISAFSCQIRPARGCGP